MILAAGMGRRLGFVYPPKPIVMFSKPLLYYPLSSLVSIGVNNIYIVVNPWHKTYIERVMAYLSSITTKIEILWNYWEENGSSLLIGLKSAFTSGENEVILTMGDHIFEPSLPLKSFNMLNECSLSVAGDKDPNWVDINEATKIISYDNKYAKFFGKKIKRHDFIDTGVFAFRKESLDIIKEAYKSGALTVSEIMNHLARKTEICIADVTRSDWIDVDTFSELIFKATNVIKRIDEKFIIKFFKLI